MRRLFPDSRARSRNLSSMKGLLSFLNSSSMPCSTDRDYGYLNRTNIISSRIVTFSFCSGKQYFVEDDVSSAKRVVFNVPVAGVRIVQPGRVLLLSQGGYTQIRSSNRCRFAEPFAPLLLRLEKFRSLLSGRKNPFDIQSDSCLSNTCMTTGESACASSTSRSCIFRPKTSERHAQTPTEQFHIRTPNNDLPKAEIGASHHSFGPSVDRGLRLWCQGALDQK